MDKFLDFLTDKKDATKVNLEPLKEALKKLGVKKTDQAQALVSKMPTKVQIALQNIQKYLVDNNITTEQFHKSLDKNGDGVIEMKEWIGAMRQYQIRGVEEGELNVIFDSMDVNQDGEISLNEMKLFLEGVKLEKDQFIKMLKNDREFMTECHDMINELFNEFDENKD